MYLQKVIRRKNVFTKLVFCWQDPDPLDRGTDQRIRIHTKMSSAALGIVHTSILGVGFRILEVDLLVRDIHVSANDDRFLGVQTLHILPGKQGVGL
jgi:hypothetical protein